MERRTSELNSGKLKGGVQQREVLDSVGKAKQSIGSGHFRSSIEAEQLFLNSMLSYLENCFLNQ